MGGNRLRCSTSPLADCEGLAESISALQTSQYPLRLLLLSDTHELHREIDLPPADLLLHAGDWTMFSKRASAICDFDDWLGEQNLSHGAVGCPGNHEFYLEHDHSRASLTPHLRILNGSEVKIAGLRIWGSPVTALYGGAFGLCNSTQRAKHWAQIPNGIDILITHGPPLGVLDHGHGDAELLQAVRRIRPKLHLFGHVHAGYGVVENEGTTFVNAALLGPDGDLVHSPLSLEVR